MNSHLPMLNFVMSTLAFHYSKVKTSFEFGCGDYSTALMLEKSEKHYAVETIGQEHEGRSLEWFQKISEKYSSLLGNSFFFSINTHGKNLILLESIKPDIVFVDGEKRPDCVNMAFKCTQTIVCHDTEEACYGWEAIVKPDGWSQFTRGNVSGPDPYGAWTTCWTTNKRLIAVLSAIGLAEKQIPRRG